MDQIVGKVGYTRQHIDRGRKNPVKFRRVVKRFQHTFPHVTAALTEKGVNYSATNNPVENNTLNEPPAVYHTAKSSPPASDSRSQQERETIEPGLGQLLFEQTKAVIEYIAKKDSKGNPKIEKEILKQLNYLKNYPPGTKKNKGKKD